MHASSLLRSAALAGGLALLVAATVAAKSCENGDDGAPGAQGVAGFLRLVSAQTVADTMTQTVTFSGLDGDADVTYVIQGFATTTNYGPGAPIVTFGTDIADPAGVTGAILEIGIASTGSTTAIQGSGLTCFGRDIGGPTPFTGTFEMKVMARDIGGHRLIACHGSTSVLGEALIRGAMTSSGKLTTIRLSAVGFWGQGSQFRLYAYGP